MYYKYLKYKKKYIHYKNNLYGGTIIDFTLKQNYTHTFTKGDNSIIENGNCKVQINGEIFELPPFTYF
jgi:hypothetical protein